MIHGADSMIDNHCKPMGWTTCQPHGYAGTMWPSVNPMGGT